MHSFQDQSISNNDLFTVYSVLGLADIFMVKKVGLFGKTKSNGFREPQVKLLLGEDGWTEHTDNHVK